jgi:hypothetical protein
MGGGAPIEWSARGGALTADGAGALTFTEDCEEGLHGVFAVVQAPVGSHGIGVRLRLLSVTRPSCAVWVRRMGTDDIGEVFFDFENVSYALSGKADARAEIAELESGCYELWFSLAEPRCEQGYRIDIVSRRDHEGSSKFIGDGRPAFVIADAEAADADLGLLRGHAASSGFRAEANVANVRDYYDAFFTAEKFARALVSEKAVADGASALFEQLLQESDPPACLSLREMADKFLSADEALRLDMDAAELVSALADDGFRQRLRGASKLRAAIAVRLPSDFGVEVLRETLAIERVSGIGRRTDEVLKRSPRLLAAALFAAAGFHGAGPYLNHVGANRFCFDPFVLTRPYSEFDGAPMERIGLVLLSLERRSSEVAP